VDAARVLGGRRSEFNALVDYVLVAVANVDAMGGSFDTYTQSKQEREQFELHWY